MVKALCRGLVVCPAYFSGQVGAVRTIYTVVTT